MPGHGCVRDKCRNLVCAGECHVVFRNEASLLRLVSAILCEISEERLAGKIYPNMNPVDRPLN